MDLVTQGVLGAAVGFAVMGRTRPRAALALGFLGGLLPDGDIVFASSDSIDYWAVHRGMTHSLFFGPVLGLALAALSRFTEKRRAAPPHHSFLRWYLFWALSLVTHPMLDALTIYGTQLLWPLSDRPYGVAGVSIIDPVYTLPLLGAAIYAAFTTNRTRAMRVMVAMLVATTAYLGLSWSQNPRAQRLAEEDLAARGIAVARVDTYTTIFSPWLRRMVATKPDGRLLVGFVSTINPQPIRWLDVAYDAEAEALAKTFAGTEAGHVFNRFAVGPKAAAFHTTEAGQRELRISDARYGFAGGVTLDGFWGIAFPIDANGKPAGAAYRFMRPRDGDLPNIGAFFRATFGLDQDVM
jgi:inner membrane protein